MAGTKGVRALRRQARMEELLTLERDYWARGITVAGMDEAGRGPLAGPVVAACVVTPPEGALPGVDDSKKLSERRREQLAPLIRASAQFVGLGVVSHERIDEVNILCATREAMSAAARDSGCGVLLVDAVSGLDCDCEVRSIVHGDAICYAIAAASIVAKAHRDALMREYDALYPEYGFARHKGYGTAEHIAALIKYGPCPIHRRSFISKWL